MAARVAPRGDLGRSALLAVLVAAAACGPGPRPPEPERPTAGPVPTREPFVRIGVRTGPDSVRVSSPRGLRVTDPSTGRPVMTPSGPEPVRLARRGSVVGVEGGGTHRALVLSPAGDGEAIALDGRSYRGTLEVYPVPGHGLVVVNQVDLEAYLRGVVPVEIGPRSPEEREAVKVQAVAARTYAVANLGRRDSLGFDMFGSVEDQVYGGVGEEREEVTRAVRATAGEILVYGGRPIRAFYHSTGGGTTARVTDAWNREDAPYLRRVSDRRPGGGHYCEASPRYRWEERWTAEELGAAVRRGVAGTFGADSSRVGRVLDVEVTGRTDAGRATGLAVRTAGGRWHVTKDDIRFFLRTPDGRGLRSTWFDVVEGPSEEGGLHLAGRGYGHGVGMCQWGAIGRARAGHGYAEILSHYYPGARLRDAY